jgi:hypothetical protein
MRRALLISALMVAFAAPAGASQCPKDMAAIDSAMESVQLSDADKAKVMELRKTGEEQHKTGQHDASMETLAEAKTILGIK